MDNATRSYRISAWTGEFVDACVEAEYRRRRAGITARHAIVAITVAGLFFLLFGATDWLALGWTPALERLLVVRGSVLALGLVVALWIHLSPAAAVRGRAASLFEVAGFTAFWVVTTLRQDPMEFYGMSMVAMLAGVYLFIPNRALYTLGVGAFATLGYTLLLITEGLVDLRASLADLLLLLLLVNTFGFIAAHRLSIAQRQEFRLLARAEQANARLADEIERRRYLERELTRLATTDSLTGLCNRRQYLELSRQELQRAARSRQPVAALLLDIDFFKRVNDTFGHSIGDDALRTLSRVLRHELRGTDIIARFGGEEFAITLPDTAVERAQAVAERIRAAIGHQRIPGAPPSFRLTVTVGVAVHDGRGESVEALINRADRALYQGKTTGRDRVVTLGPVIVRHGG